MSRENVKRFYESLSRDSALQETFRAAGKRYAGKQPTEAEIDILCETEVIPAARAAGYEFTLAELKAYGLEAGKARTGELTDDELACVAGGATCGCVMIGGGTGEGAWTCMFVGCGDDHFCCLIGA